MPNLYEEKTITFKPLPREDLRLGRVVAHDSRSLAYALSEPRTAPVSVKHKRYVPVFNQGNVGSCTTNAGLGCLGTGPFYAATTVSFPNLEFSGPHAKSLYSAVTKIDEFKGEYPPTDTGSSGNAVGKLFKQQGWIKGWLHGIKWDAVLAELSLRPVITGVEWFDTFDRPDSNGFITRKSNSRSKGGHEFVVDELNFEEEWVGCTNSWGTNYGDQGRFKMTFKLWQALLADRGDVTAFVPLTGVAPVPTPTPTPVDRPDAADITLAATMRQWMTKRGI